MADPTLTQVDDRELENMSVDADNFPYKKTRGMLYWTGSAWAKWDGALKAGSATLGGVRIINTDNSDNSYTSGGVYFQKVGIVAWSDMQFEGVVAAGSSLTARKPLAGGFKDATGNNQFILGDTTGGQWVAGAVASGATDSGNPVKIGGRYNSSLPTLTNGQRGDVQLTSKGMVRAALYTEGGTALNDSGGNLVVNVGNFATGSFGDADTTAANLTSALSFSENLLYDSGANKWVRLRGDTTNGAFVNVKAIAAGNNIIGKVAGSIPSGATRVTKTVTATTAQTGTAIITPTSGKTLTIKYVQIQVGGTTAGKVQVWFGGSGDTTYSRGTDPAIFDGEFAPSSTLKPGFVTPSVAEGWTSGTANDVLRYTTSAAMTITITAWGYEA